MIPALAAIGLVVGAICASLAEAIRGLGPETLSLPEELEEDDLASALAQVTERFVAAEAKLRAGAIVSLGAAAFLVGRAQPGPLAAVGAGAVTAAAAVIFGLLLPDHLVYGREAAILGRATRLVFVLATVLGPVTAVQRRVGGLLAALVERGGRGIADEAPIVWPAAMPAPTGALEKVMSFVDATIEEVMTQRVDMEMLESGQTVADVAALVARTRHGRFPVYRGSRDEVIGTIDIADLLDVADAAEVIDGHLRQLPVMPETRRAWDLLLDMEARGESMTLVVDEFGAVSGLVTHADLLAEIVGEIAEEGETAPVELHRVDGHTWDVQAFIKVDRLNELIGIGIPEGEYQTLSGFILARLGRIPAARERLRWGNAELSILDAEPRRIRRVRIRLRRARRRRGGRSGRGDDRVQRTNRRRNGRD